MNITDLIYRLIPLLLFAVIIMNPLLKKMIKKKLGENQKQEEGPAKSPLIKNPEPTAPIALSSSYSPSRGTIDSLRQAAKTDEKQSSPMEKLDKLPDLKKAVVWSEILSKPLGLRD